MKDDEKKDDEILDQEDASQGGEPDVQKDDGQQEGEPDVQETDGQQEDDADVQEDDDLEEDRHSDYKPANRFDASAVHHLSGMYQNWFLDYVQNNIKGLPSYHL